MRRLLLLGLGAVVLAWACGAWATETENLGIRALPAPGAVTIDGAVNDWDLSGALFTCGDVEHQRDHFGVWTSAMYDANNLYVLARWIDETPLNNPGQAAGSYGFAGDCLQMRFITNPGKPNERTSHWTCWRDRDQVSVMDVAYGKQFNEGHLKDAQAKGAKMAFRVNPDGKGYVQEMAIPWALLTKDAPAPKAGDAFVMTLEPNFSIGESGRLTLKDLFKAGIVPDRVFTFMANTCWGMATLEARDAVAPAPVRLSDGREFAIKLDKGVPVVDWTGLIQSKEPRGFKPIPFTMPADGYISLQIVDAGGQVVCNLLNNAFLTKGKHTVMWDGLTTMNWRTPGTPVVAGAYTWRALWHQEIGLRLKGWADNGGSAPWDASPTSNWGGDEGTPVGCATDGDKVFLSWSGAEAGKALLGCDLNGNVQWKNNRQGMAGAEFVAVDHGTVYAANWGDEGGNVLYRVQAANGSYVDWGNGTPDLAPREIFPNPATAPHRIDGMAARNGKLYLSFVTANFRREQVTDWRAVLTGCQTGDGLAGEAWKRLDANTKSRAERWLAGNPTDEEGLKAPNYYTPDIRDAMVGVFNGMLRDRGLAKQSELLSADAVALANRRALEALFPRTVVKIDTSFVGVVDAKSRKLVQRWPVSNPRHLCAVSDTLLYVVSDASTVVALNPVTGEMHPVVTGLQNATGIAVDKAGLLYVGTREPDQQVKVFTADGKPVRTIGRQGGRALHGPWTPDGLLAINGLAVDDQGKLWVAETDMWPKRISVWETTTGKLLNEFFGPTTYGALGGAINPVDPSLMVGAGCEWRLDPKTGKATCLGTITRDGMENSRFALGGNGRLYLAVAGGQHDRAGMVRIFERLGDADYKPRASFTIAGQDKAAKTTYWADANGDEREQPEEVTTVDGAINFSGWYMYLAPDLSIYAGTRQYKVTGFTACGAPRYDLAHPVTMPIAGMGSADGQYVMTQGDYNTNTSWNKCYDIASGKLRWQYPDNFVGVHGSHNAVPPEVGMIRGSFGPCGTAKLPAPIGNIWVIATNVGEWHILTEDGFYLTKLFQGDPMKITWPEKAVPGAILDNVPPGMGGEDFGGSCCYAKDGTLYLQAGKTGFWNIEVTGLDTVRAMKGGKVEVTAPDVKLAQQYHDNYLQAAVGTRRMSVTHATPAFTGTVAKDFGEDTLIRYRKDDAEIVSAAAWDADNLYLGWQVRDRTPWQNSADDPAQMYIGGDTVDFQLGADPKADKHRAESVAGDLRLSIGNFHGKPTAVLYRKISAEKKPRTFSSGVIKAYQMDDVDVLADAKITVNIQQGREYTVEAVIPLPHLGLHPAEGLTLRGDFGATFGDAAGRTRLRSYWSNQHTGIVDDAVFELMLEPKNWGEVTFR